MTKRSLQKICEKKSKVNGILEKYTESFERIPVMEFHTLLRFARASHDLIMCQQYVRPSATWFYIFYYKFRVPKITVS